MFGKDFMNMFTIERIILLIVIAIGVYFFMNYSQQKGFVMDTMTTADPMPNALGNGNGARPADLDNSMVPAMTMSTALSGNGMTQSRPTASPSDLLPSETNSLLGNMNNLNQQNGIMIPDLLQAGYHIGLDTIGQSLRNPNYQLRSDPIIPRKDVGPWNQTTMEPDYARVPLEVGAPNL